MARQAMRADTISDAIGSSRYHPPRHQITAPATSTPTEAAASDIMCSHTERMLRSCSCPPCSKRADARLTVTATNAVHTTGAPWTTPGSSSRRTASHTRNPVTIRIDAALA